MAWRRLGDQSIITYNLNRWWPNASTVIKSSGRSELTDIIQVTNSHYSIEHERTLKQKFTVKFVNCFEIFVSNSY